ncbi:hypothetical protein Tco_0352571 [Tanacetum coccineum]
MTLSKGALETSSGFQASQLDVQFVDGLTLGIGLLLSMISVRKRSCVACVLVLVTMDHPRVLGVLGLNVGEIGIVGKIGIHGKIRVYIVVVVVVEKKFGFEIVVFEVVAIIRIDRV